ncbi:hypothetical protein MUG09_00970 [Sphaerochaeta associata]|uniref:Uncharacterized protein n=1 Tax=Sphaerochaeta associata TaxID=1129264 RepID=A0ABY4DEI0_9SPIR|nr:hypothetical protein [Sphaerochaeta associata]UOM51342.1 hypothetical protein MUG09_00970 [Sphaerochaeta associata]
MPQLLVSDTNISGTARTPIIQKDRLHSRLLGRGSDSGLAAFQQDKGSSLLAPLLCRRQVVWQPISSVQGIACGIALLPWFLGYSKHGIDEESMNKR